MSQLTYFGNPAGAPSNPVDTYEEIGTGVADAGTTVTAAASAHTKGSYVQLTGAGAGGVTVNDWSDFWVLFSGMSASTTRVLADISIDGGSTVKCPDLFAQCGSGTTGAVIGTHIRMAVPAGSSVGARIQAHIGNLTCAMKIIGVVANANSRPGFSTMEALNADTANTRPSTIDVPLTGTWTELVPSTAAAYGALMVTAGANGTAFGTVQNAGLYLATGASGSEVALSFRQWMSLVNSNPPMKTGELCVYENTIASGVRLSAKAVAPTPGTDAVRVLLHGFS